MNEITHKSKIETLLREAIELLSAGKLSIKSEEIRNELGNICDRLNK